MNYLILASSDISNWSWEKMATVAVILAALVGIVVVATKAMGVVIPSWLWTIIVICIIAVVAIAAVHFVSSL